MRFKFVQIDKVFAESDECASSSGFRGASILFTPKCWLETMESCIVINAQKTTVQWRDLAKRGKFNLLKKALKKSRGNVDNFFAQIKFFVALKRHFDRQILQNARLTFLALYVNIVT